MSVDSDELWEASAADCNLEEGQVYHYRLEVTDTAPFGAPPPATIRCTDPTAYAVDWRLRANGGDDDASAAVVRFQNGRLVPTDPELSPVLFDATVPGRDVPHGEPPAQ